MRLDAEQQAGWDDNGFIILRGFADEAQLGQMIDRISELARSLEAGEERPDLIAQPEERLAHVSDPAARLSKLFRVMRSEEVFRSFATDPRLLDVIGGLLGPDVDCFLSQFIFKHPGALGQPWHQDSFYFRLEPAPQVGVWLACTEATRDNGPLSVVPGSHREVIHDAIRDPRENANMGYVEIVDADVTDAEVVLMDPGDVLVFHSYLRHMSTDNESDSKRAAMVYHYADAACTGPRVFNHDWVEVLRDGSPVTAPTEPVPVDWG